MDRFCGGLGVGAQASIGHSPPVVTPRKTAPQPSTPRPILAACAYTSILLGARAVDRIARLLREGLRAPSKSTATKNFESRWFEFLRGSACTMIIWDSPLFTFYVLRFFRSLQRSGQISPIATRVGPAIRCQAA